MSSGPLKVDPQALLSAAQQIKTLPKTLYEVAGLANNAASTAEASAAYPALSAAINESISAWKPVLLRMGEEMQYLLDGLEEAAKQYAGTDAGVSQGMGS